MAINEFQKYPTNKRRFDSTCLRLWGEICKACVGKGYHCDVPTKMKHAVKTTCIICNGHGLVEKGKQ